MTVKNDAKFEVKLTCGLENDMRNMENFHQSTCKMSKLGLWWDPFIQSRKCMIYRGFDSWQWRMIQNFKRNWLVVLKLIWGTSQILTQVYNVWAKKVQRSYVWWHWRLTQNFIENWLVFSKMTQGIWKLFTTALESLKIETLKGSFCPI